MNSIMNRVYTDNGIDRASIDGRRGGGTLLASGVEGIYHGALFA
jgi:hypothetical protein